MAELNVKNPYQAIIDVIDIILTKNEIAPKGITIHVCETPLPQSGLGSEQLRQILDMLKRSGAITEDMGRSPHVIKVKKTALFKERKKWIDNGDDKEKHLRTTNKKLNFYADSGEAEYMTAIWQFKGKARAFLTVLQESKNMNFNVADIQKYCNPLIEIDRHKFKKEKDINDTLREIRYRLKASKGEFFPIFKQEKGWIWLEK